MRASGLVALVQRPQPAKGHVFLSLKDETGLVNVILRPRVYARHRQTVWGKPLLVVAGRVQRRDGAIRVITRRITALDAAGPERVGSRFFR